MAVKSVDVAQAQEAVATLLFFLGEDPGRPGLVDTPARVVKALREMTAGLHEDPAAVLCRTFDEAYDQLIVVRDVAFTSLCEHHLLPFTGYADVGYVPDGTAVVGLSKLARLVDVYARRPQVQERMTQQIADAIQKHLGAQAVGVVVRARHACMGCRGVMKPEAEMVTSVMLGGLREDVRLRDEFVGLTTR